MKISKKEFDHFMNEVLEKIITKGFELQGNGKRVGYYWEPIMDKAEPEKVATIRLVSFEVSDLTASQRTRKITLEAILKKYFSKFFVQQSNAFNYHIQIFDVLEGKTVQTLRKRRIKDLLSEED